MKYLILLLVTYTALVCQTSLRQPLAVGTAAPSFLGLATITALVTLPSSGALAWVAVIGLLADCVSGGPLGVNMLTATLTALAIVRLRPGQSRPSVLYVFLLTFLFVLIWTFSSQTVRDLLEAGRTQLMGAAGTAAATALYTSGVALIPMGMWRIVRRKSPRSHGSRGLRRAVT